MLKGKTVVIGVTGSIAAYKIANLVSMLKKSNADIHVIMTKNATNFINPITFETISGNKCLIDTFDRNFEFNVEHIELAKRADIFLVAPASANIIGKIANGIADDMLSTTIMAAQCKKIISPVMNTNMLVNPIVQNNIDKLKKYGFEIIEPVKGYLACGDTGSGKMPEPELLFLHIVKEVAYEKDFAGKNVLVTAGPTREKIDPVRFISNHSTGKMGYAMANAAMLRGANVTLISGPVSIKKPEFVKIVSVETAQEMYEEVNKHFEGTDIVIMAAAVADFRPSNPADEKLKKDSNSNLVLKRTKDILFDISMRKEKKQFVCGFSMETENMIENSRAKLVRKNLDMIVANNLKEIGAGFKTDTNIVTIITRDSEIELPKLTKNEVAHKILNSIRNNVH